MKEAGTDDEFIDKANDAEFNLWSFIGPNLGMKMMCLLFFLELGTFAMLALSAVQLLMSMPEGALETILRIVPGMLVSGLRFINWDKCHVGGLFMVCYEPMTIKVNG